MELKIGADPELFAKKDGEYVSAHGLIPGDKANPYPVKNGAVQVDGMALEFNIDPALTQKEFVKNINTVIAQLGEMLPGYEVMAHATAEFSKEVWDSVPDEAKVLGCEPDMDAWTGEANKPPNAKATYRTGAGHIHLGWCEGMDIADPEHVDACRMMGKQLDYLLYLPSLAYDPDRKRRELYGKPGAIRIKPYGVEYRVLSNFWVGDNSYMRWVYDTCQMAFARLMAGDYVPDDSRPIDYYEKNFNALRINRMAQLKFGALEVT